LNRLGHQTLVLDQPDPDLAALWASASDRPDVVLVTDHLGRRSIPEGLDRIEALKVYYGVDAPINEYWQRHFAMLFDLVLADQKDAASRWAERRPAVYWLPVAVDVDRYRVEPARPTHDLAFVGVVHAGVRPKRSAILNRLSAEFRLLTAGGRRDRWVDVTEAARLHRRAKLALNENLFPGVTTRMFEIMAAGAPLLTEADSNGLNDLFEPGRHLIAYGPDDLIHLVRAYLDDPAARDEMAGEGRAEVLARHDLGHRAETLCRLIARTRPEAAAAGASYHRFLGRTLLRVGLRWPDHDGAGRLARSARHLQIAAGSDPDPGLAFDLGALAQTTGDVKAARWWFDRSARQGSVRAGLALGFLALEQGSIPAARAWLTRGAAAEGIEFPKGFPQSGLSADQHLALGRLCLRRGRDLTPGFNRRRLPLCLWTGLDHLVAARTAAPDDPRPPARIGRLLAERGLWTEAADAWEAAVRLAPGRDDYRAAHLIAARRGYRTPDPARKVA
jgi:hypothetical protein